MNINKQFLKQAGIFLLFLIGFWAISAIYLKPAYDNMTLAQTDMQQTRLMIHEAQEYKATHGHYPGWVDGIFSGMPTSLISGLPNGNLVYTTGIFQLFNLITTPVSFLFVAMLGMFVLLLAADVNRWLAAAGAIGYAFMTFSVSSYEAGHITKVLAMGVMPGVLGGLLLISRKKYLWGAATMGTFFAIVVGYFHYQIAYYTGIIAGIFALVELIRAFRAKETKHALIVMGLSVACLAAGALSSVGKIVDTAQYAEATMRGGSEVASETPKNGPQKQEANKKGLEKEYAFRWSYGISESFTLLVPDFVGSSSGYELSESQASGISEQFAKLMDENFRGRAPMYFGDLPSTSGPVYFGAVFILLFVFGIVTVLGIRKHQPDSPIAKQAMVVMWFSIITTLLSLMLAWGKNFPLNDLLFEYLPYYNKFRTPMMALAIGQVTVPFFGLYALNLFLRNTTEDKTRKEIFKLGAICIGALMGLAALVILVNGFSSEIVTQMRKAGYKEAATDLMDLRSGVVWGDWFRSLVLIGLGLGVIYMFAVKGKNLVGVYVSMLVLVAFDLIGVSHRYLNDSNWQPKDSEEAIVPSAKDEALMKIDQNKSRVFDLRIDPFNDNHSAPWHRNIGGYHPAKLSRYQDLISYCITPNGGQLSYESLMKNNALDMLNCKYLLTRSQDAKQEEEVIPRNTNLGNAWFAKKVITVQDAKTALLTINSCKIKEEVVVENKEKLKPSATEYSADSTSSVAISHYSLDTIQYVSKNSGKGLAVFSEIYYNQKNGAWRATIDGKPAEVLRVNYMLRALEVPAGEHKIEFIFDFKGNRYLGLEKASSGMLLLLLAIAVFTGLFTRKEENNKVEADA